MQRANEAENSAERTVDQSSHDVLPPLYHQWPLRGTGLAALKLLPSEHGDSLTQQEKEDQDRKIRQALIAMMNAEEKTTSRDTHHLAFLLLKRGRGGIMVGNPSAIRIDNGKHVALPYTGLEGYYAGSEKTTTRPGMTPEDILLEEAHLGAEVLKIIKKEAREQNTWTTFARLQQIFHGAPPQQEDLRQLQRFFGMVIGRLHVRVYHNPEFALTPSESIEQAEEILAMLHATTEEEQKLKQNVEGVATQLKHDYAQLSPAQQKQERQERARREQIRIDRLEEFSTFRDETYRILTTADQKSYQIGIQDTSPANTMITETIVLPAVPERSTYPSITVRLTPQQLEGYLFLAKLGEIGGDPLVRSVYK